MSTTKPTSNERLFKQARAHVATEWKGLELKLGHRLLRALLAEEVLWLAAQQDESIPAENVRKIVDEGWTWVIEEAGY